MQRRKKFLDCGKNWAFHSVLNSIQNCFMKALSHVTYVKVYELHYSIKTLSKSIPVCQRTPETHSGVKKASAKGRLWAVPPRNCQQTVIPSEKKGDAKETVESVCLPSYLRFCRKGNYRLMWHCVYSDSSLSSFLMPSREGFTPDLWQRGPITILYLFFIFFHLTFILYSSIWILLNSFPYLLI